MPYPLPLTRTEAYLAYKAGVIQQSDLKPSLAVPRNGIDAWLAYWTGLAADYPKREDGTPHILQEEEAYIAYLCGVINEYPEKCLRRVGAYLRYLISARWGRPDHPLNREELYLSLIKTQFIPSGDPSSDITIDGTAKAPFVDVKMYGDTFQQSYTGKNLMAITRRTAETKNGVTCTWDGASFTLNGTTTASTDFYGRGWLGATSGPIALPAGTYTISLRKSDGSLATDADFSVDCYYGTAWVIGIYRGNSGAGYRTETFDSDTQYSVLYIYLQSGKTYNNEKFYIQLEKSESPTAYEPFVGGQPSPNPEYPQPIQTVTGLQTVEVRGKNLFRAKDGQYRDNTLTVDVDNGRIHVYGHQHASYDQNVWIPVEDIHADGTYTLTMNYSGSGGGAFRLTKDKSYQEANNFGGTYYVPNRATPVTASATNITYNWILIYLGHGSSLSEVDYYINPQFESGSVSTTFSPYSKQTYTIDLGSIELCKLGTYQDYIWKDGDDWKVHKATKKVLLSGSEGWGYGGVPNIYYSSRITGYALSGNVLYADHFNGTDNVSGAGAMSTEADNSIAFINSSSPIRLYIKSSTVGGDTTGVNLRAWLAENPTTLYYALATPTDTTITDTALIAQLEALVAGGAEDGTTYIKVDATDPNLPGLLYVEAPKYE